MSYPKHHNLFSKLIPVDHNNHVLTNFFSPFLNSILFVRVVSRGNTVKDDLKSFEKKCRFCHFRGHVLEHKNSKRPLFLSKPAEWSFLDFGILRFFNVFERFRNFVK